MQGKRKSERPLSTQHVHHLVLKAENLQLRFLGVSLTRARATISRCIRDQAKKHNVTLEAYSINWNHIHSAIAFKSKKDYTRFIRSLTAKIIAILSKLFGRSLSGLFNLRPYTKIISWGRQYQSLLRYIQINAFESEGVDVDVTGRWAKRKARAPSTATISDDERRRTRINWGLCYNL